MGGWPSLSHNPDFGDVDLDAKILSIGKNYTIEPKSLTAMEI
jgi:hypothetical protein